MGRNIYELSEPFDTDLMPRLVSLIAQARIYGMANHGIFRDFFLTQRAKFGDNPARFFATLHNFRSAVLRDFLRS